MKKNTEFENLLLQSLHFQKNLWKVPNKYTREEVHKIHSQSDLNLRVMACSMLAWSSRLAGFRNISNLGGFRTSRFRLTSA